MIRKITLHNFMSHRHTVIEPSPGLTVLVGENNCGKSAVVAALQILCNNTNGEYMVRHGESECRVIVETDEGHVVEWRRDNGTVSYVLNGQVIHRLRGGIPDNLHKLLRMPQVCSQDGGDPFEIHFGEQKKPVFLLDESGGRAAKFFASSSDAEALIRMQLLHKSNIRDATQRSFQLQAQIKLLERRVQPLERVPDIQDQLGDLEDRYARLMIAGRKALSLVQDLENLQESVSGIGSLEAETRILGKLETPPRVRDTISLDALIGNLSRWLESHLHSECQKQTLDVLQVPPRLADTGVLEELAEAIAQTSHEIRNVTKTKGILAGLKTVPALVSTKSLETMCEEMRSCIGQTQYQGQRAECVARLRPPAEPFDIDSLFERIAEIERARHQTLRSQETSSALGKCKPPPELGNEQGLVELLGELERATSKAEVSQSVCEVLAIASRPPSPLDSNTLNALIEGFNARQQSVEECGRQLEKAESSASVAEKAVRAWAAENRICPTCGAELDPDRLVTMAASASGGHVHG